MLFGLLSSVTMALVMIAALGLGITRFNLPLMIGTMVTDNRRRAMLVGFVAYIVIGWLFAFVYIAVFAGVHIHTWWFGAILGFIHGVCLLVAMPFLPFIHPRMASEYHGVTELRLLEPPGFMAMNYGYATPVTTALAQTLFGAVLGLLTQLHFS
jgi:hypothetical protein